MKNNILYLDVFKIDTSNGSELSAIILYDKTMLRVNGSAKLISESISKLIGDKNIDIYSDLVGIGIIAVVDELDKKYKVNKLIKGHI